MVVIIGCDESLKGDTFGGLVVAAVKCNDGQRGRLAILGVRDCKKITDGRVRELAAEIKKVAKYSIQSVLPQEYNKYKLTDLMNKLFKKAISDLRPADEIIVDKFPGCKVGDICEARADSKYTEVAAARKVAPCRHQRVSEVATIYVVVKWDPTCWGKVSSSFLSHCSRSQ